MGRYAGFSPKQLAALCWWCPGSPWEGRDAILCDGAVRSGKTFCLSLGFALWATVRFDGKAFGLCGKTAGALRRNLVAPLLPALAELGFGWRENAAKGWLDLWAWGHKNRFYLFGGRDEGSAALIQGVTLAGVLLDEAALMPRSFVEQALARCSEEGARSWFSCNPEHPGHWFYTEWVKKAGEKNALRLHFLMEDNPTLSPAVRRRYESLYSGSFYRRFILGEWAAGQGAVYPMFDPAVHVVERAPRCGRFFISCDYGTVNPASFGLWGLGPDGVWYRLAEYYHDSRRTGQLLTDEEYHEELVRLAGGRRIEAVIVDPSAASFLECIRRHGRFTAAAARNEVADGIRTVSTLLKQGRLRFCAECRDCIREFSLYRWDEGAGRDQPVKRDDHAMDDLRYFVMTALAPARPGYYVAGVARRGRTAGGG